jgi:mercuric ion transport protein
MEEAKKDTLLGAGAVAAAIGASLCCILPVAVAVLGVGSAAAAARFEPYRPYLLATTAALLAFAFYRAYKPVACAPGEACAVPANRRRHRIALWMVAALALALIAFPYYSTWLF